ncbi:hypothetical protein [Mycobacterium sp. RTGN5]|uniref:hypothetical protein n=1 Tax=Mycobacterium sp. RTGN5 TaxID=3016522 RepID=UPI0029C8A501|nr:hypothetical protein [Mycobacterium sp. RTGN5]
MSGPDQPEATDPDATVQQSNFIDGFLRSPFSGIAPWILMAIMSGPGRFGQSAAAALTLTLIVMWASSRRGIKVHSLEVFGAVVFATFVALGIVGSPTMVGWLELWAGEITNGALAAYALTTLMIRRPFTISYARDTVDPEHWNSPLFVRVNYVLSAVWAGAFVINTAVGTFGDAVLRDGDNFWTGWIVQLAVTLAAVAITEFYPDYARAKFLAATGQSSDSPPPLGKLLEWLPGFVIGVGIAGWVSDSFSAGVGIALIAVGIVAGAVMQKLFPVEEGGQ